MLLRNINKVCVTNMLQWIKVRYLTNLKRLSIVNLGMLLGFDIGN